MPTTTHTGRDGMAVGVIAYAAVAVFYLAFDLLAARGPLYTVDLLGKAAFRGLRDPGVLQYPAQVDLTAVFWYNALHLVTALAIGLIVLWLIREAERHPSHARGILFTIMAGFVVTILGVAAVTRQMRPVLPVWSIIAANGFATLLAGLYLLRRRPGLWRRLTAGGG